MSNPTPCPICAPTDTRGDPVVLVECDACGGVAWLAVGEVETLTQTLYHPPTTRVRFPDINQTVKP